MFSNKLVEVVDLSDAKQFKKGYERYFTALKYFAMHYLGDEDVVLDLLQDFFLKLWEKRETFRNEDTFRVYLYRGVRNNCLTYIRDKKRAEKRLEGYAPEEIEEDFVSHVIEAEVFSLINQVFEELPESCKKVYRLSLEGKSHQEIADELHIAINTIKRHKNNANHYIRERLEKLLVLMILLSSDI